MLDTFSMVSTLDATQSYSRDYPSMEVRTTHTAIKILSMMELLSKMFINLLQKYGSAVTHSGLGLLIVVLNTILE